MSLSPKSITRTFQKCKTSFAKLPCISPWSISSRFYTILKTTTWARSQILQSCSTLFKTCYPPDKSIDYSVKRYGQGFIRWSFVLQWNQVRCSDTSKKREPLEEGITKKPFGKCKTQYRGWDPCPRSTKADDYKVREKSYCC